MTTYTQLKAQAVSARLNARKALTEFCAATAVIDKQGQWEAVCEYDRELDCCEAQIEQIEADKGFGILTEK